MIQHFVEVCKRGLQMNAYKSNVVVLREEERSVCEVIVEEW